MQFVNTETTDPTTVRSDSSAGFLETVELKDRFGNVLLTLQKTAAGTFTIGGATVAELTKLSGTGTAIASGTQATAIADPSGGATQDAEARTAINDIIDALEAFGVTAVAE